MRKDGVYGTVAEVNAFCNLCQIRITCYIRYIKNDRRTKQDILVRNTFGEIYDENFAIMLSDYGVENEIDNHFEALEPKGGYNINKNKFRRNKRKIM